MPGGNYHGLSMVTYYPKHGNPQTQGWSPTSRRCTTNIEFWDLDLDCHGWSPTNPKMGTHQQGVYYRLGNWHLKLNNFKMVLDCPKVCTSSRHCSWSLFRWLISNNDSGPLFSPFFSLLLFFSVTTFSHRTAVWIKNLYSKSW